MPSATRAGDQDSATVFYRCGSQQGKAATTVPAGISPEAFQQLTVDFVRAQADAYRTAIAAKQKNANRNLKKFFDAADIHLLEDRRGDISDEEITTELL